MSQIEQPIVDGTIEWPGAVKFEPKLLPALVGFGAGRVRALCSAVALRADAIITAKHCFEDDSLTYYVVPADVSVDGWDPADCLSEARTVTVRQNATGIDLALAWFEPPLVNQQGMRLTAFEDTDRKYFTAGVGINNTGDVGKLLFGRVSVTSVTSVSLDVRQTDGGGACNGDSGGPLLMEDEKDVALVGILSAGSASCRDSDRYLRLDQVYDWIREEVPTSVWLQTPEVK